MPQTIGGAILAIQTHIDTKIRPEAIKSDNVYVQLESEITAREFDNLAKTYSRSDQYITEESLTPLLDFLAKRWERVKGTPADYRSAPETFATLLCKSLARSIAHKLKGATPTKAEIKERYEFGDYPDSSTDEEAVRKLRNTCASHLSRMLTSSDELIDLMVTKIDKSDWRRFISCCDLAPLKSLFMQPGFINKHSTLYDAVVALATDEDFYSADKQRNAAKLFCMIEIYKRQRNLDPKFLGLFGRASGVGGNRKVNQAEVLQEFIVDDEASDLDKFMQRHPIEAVWLYRDRLGGIATFTKDIKTYVPENLDQRPQAAGLGK